MAKNQIKKIAQKQPAKKGRPRKALVPADQPKKMTYEERKELKLKLQKKKETEKPSEASNKDRFYCTNKELFVELEKWRDSNYIPEERIISEELGKMLMQIGQKVLNRSEFRNYPKELKEDCFSFGIYKIIRGLKNYDFRFNNPFSFFTTAFWTAYLTVLKKHYKQINIKKDLMEKLLSEMETFSGINPASSLTKCIKMYLNEGQNDGE